MEIKEDPDYNDKKQLELEESIQRLKKSTKVKSQNFIIQKKLVNLSPKKVKNMPEDASDHKRNHKNLIKDGTKFVKIHDWMKVHKNQLQRRAVGDMVPIHYEQKDVWDAMSDIILIPSSDESKLFFEEIANYKLGHTKEFKTGYQYLLSKNFPMIYESVEVPREEKKKSKRVTSTDLVEDNQTDGQKSTTGTRRINHCQKEIFHQQSAPKIISDEKIIKIVEPSSERRRPETRSFEPIKLLNNRVNESEENIKSSMRLNAGFPAKNHPIFQKQKINADLIKFTSSPFLSQGKKPQKFIKPLVTSPESSTPVSFSPHSVGTRTSHRYKRNQEDYYLNEQMVPQYKEFLNFNRPKTQTRSPQQNSGPPERRLNSNHQVVRQVYKIEPSSGIFMPRDDIPCNSYLMHNRSRSNMGGSNPGPFVDQTISEKFNKIMNDKVKISELLETNRLLRSSGSTKQESTPSIKYDQISKQRHQYVDKYFTKLNSMGDSFKQVEQQEIEKLLQQDRVAQKQISLFQTYGKKMKFSLNSERRFQPQPPLSPMVDTASSQRATQVNSGSGLPNFYQ